LTAQCATDAGLSRLIAGLARAGTAVTSSDCLGPLLSRPYTEVLAAVGLLFAGAAERTPPALNESVFSEQRAGQGAFIVGSAARSNGSTRPAASARSTDSTVPPGTASAPRANGPSDAAVSIVAAAPYRAASTYAGISVGSAVVTAILVFASDCC
jgi:hypothetical protein